MSTIAISLTKPLETFVQRKLAEGYASADEVARQALLRWMEEDEADLDATPPRLHEKLAEAAQGPFKPVDRRDIERILASAA